MSTIYVSVDPAWSYNLIGGLKDELREMDLYKFTDRIYQLLADYVRITHNFRITHLAEHYNNTLRTIWEDLEVYGNIPVPYFQTSFRLLFNTHLAVFNAITLPIVGVNTITNDTGELQGFVFITE